MAIAIAFVLALALFAGFLALTAREARAGTRLFGALRSRLDARVEEAVGALGHVDLASLTAHYLRDVGKRAAHDVAHILLAGVEALQAFLRRLVVRLRSHHAPAQAAAHPFAEYMSRVKKPSRPAAPSGETTTTSEVE